MAIETTTNIWHNGELIPWESANIHVMSHVVHYGSSIFEGIRCYTQPNGAGVFRLTGHMQRFIDSAKIYRMPLPFNLDQLISAVVELVEANGIAPCYIRPVAFRGYGEIGVNPLKSPVEIYMANFPWGKYVPGNRGADVCVSSWSRLAPNTMPSLAKAGANYMNSQLIRMEAEVNGYVEGIALDRNGYLSEGSGENLFLVRGGVIYTCELRAEWHHPRLDPGSGATDGYPGGGAVAATRAAVHLRRGILYRHRSRGDPPALGRPHHDRRWQHGTDHDGAA
jgi:branched-chain amino acid aminotransferase